VGRVRDTAESNLGYDTKPTGSYEAYDRKHFDSIKYDIGEVVVMLKSPGHDEPSKLQTKYRDRPLQIVEVLPGDTYRVVELAGSGRSMYATTVHVSQLKS